MLNTAYPQPATRRHSLDDLMGLYAQNYHGFLALMADLPDGFTYAVSHSETDFAAHLRVLERHTYTTILHLTYQFAEQDGVVADPDLEIRLYHDAELVEVTRCGENTHCQFLRRFPVPAGPLFDCRWAMNRLLSKWLQHLQHHHHRFFVTQ